MISQLLIYEESVRGEASSVGDFRQRRGIEAAVSADNLRMSHRTADSCTPITIAPKIMNRINALGSIASEYLIKPASDTAGKERQTVERGEPRK